MKDMSVVPDVLRYEWESWMAYRQWLERREKDTRLSASRRKQQEGEVDDLRADGRGVGEEAASAVLRLQHHRDRAENGPQLSAARKTA